MPRDRLAWLPLLRHAQEGAYRLLYFGLALRGQEELPAPDQLVAPDSSD